MALYIGEQLKTRDSELAAYLRSEGIKEDSVALESDTGGKLRVYFYFSKDLVSKLVGDFESGIAIGNIFEYIKSYKEVIRFVIGVMGTGNPNR